MRGKKLEVLNTLTIMASCLREKVDKNKLEHTGPKPKMIKKVKNDGQNDGNLRDYLAHGLTNNFLFY